MKIVREPRIYLVGRQTIDPRVLERFLADHEATWETDTEVGAEALAEAAGRLCYMSYGKGRKTNAEFLANIIGVGHGSVLEHGVWNFILTGVSRSLTHELVRHRAGWGYCLTGDTLVYSDHFANGRREGTTNHSLEKLYEMTRTPHGRSRISLLRVRCLEERAGVFTQGRLEAVVRSGIKPVFRVELEDGKSITCSRDHRFLTPQGWMPLSEIVGGLEAAPGGFARHGRSDTPLLVNGRTVVLPIPARAVEPILVPAPRSIRRIEYGGEQMTYDLVMAGENHNFVANGIVTHNSQLSQRYVNESDSDFVEPDVIAEDPELDRIWKDAIETTRQAYDQLVAGLEVKYESVENKTLRRKLARQAARSVLPNATETKIFFTANARALRHFLELRGSEHADIEIRKVALGLLEILRHESPNLFGDFVVSTVNGVQAISTPHPKV